MEYCKLKDIATIYNGNSINKTVKKQKYMQKVPGWNYISTKDVDFDGTVQYENGVIIPYAETKFRVAPAGSVFVCSEGGSAGRKTAIITEDVCFGNKLFAIVNDRDRCVGKYLYYFTRYSGFTKQFKLLATSLMGGISAKNFGAIEVPLPSLEEQDKTIRQIEELFSELDKGVETLQAIKEQLAVYRQAVLKEAFEGKWLYQNRKQVSEDVHFKIVGHSELDRLAKIPSEWQYVYLSDLGDLSRGKSKHRPRNDEKLFTEGKYPFFQTGDVKAANKLLVDCEKKYNEFGLAQSKLWPVGTLCITIAANIAETCFLGVDGCFPDSIVGFTPISSIVNKEYVRYFIEASKLRLWAFAPATAQKNINLTTLENLIIPYCNLDEQAFIVQAIESRLSLCDSIEQTVDTALAQAEAMRQSILKKAFEGELCK